MDESSVRMKGVFNRNKCMWTPWIKVPDISMSDYPTGITVYQSDYIHNIHKHRCRDHESLDMEPITRDEGMPELVSSVVPKYTMPHSTAWVQRFDYPTKPNTKKPKVFHPLMPPKQPKEPEDPTPKRQYRYLDKMNKEYGCVPEAPPLPRPSYDTLQDYQRVQYGKAVDKLQLPIKGYTGRIPDTTELKRVKAPVKNSVWTSTAHLYYKDFGPDYGIVKKDMYNPMSRCVTTVNPQNPFNQIEPVPPSIV